MISHYYFPSLSHCTYYCHNIMNQTRLTIQYLSYATPVVLQPVPIQAMPTEIPNKAYAQKAAVPKPTAILLSARPPRKHCEATEFIELYYHEREAEMKDAKGFNPFFTIG